MTATLRPHRPDSPPRTPRTTLAQRLTGRRGSVAVLVLALLLVGLASAAFGSAEAPSRGDSYPATAESSVVADQLETFPGSDRAPVLLVATKGGEDLSSADTRALDSMASQLDAAGDPSPARVSDDGEAATITLPVTVNEDSDATVETIKDLRADVAAHTLDGMTV